MKSYKIKVFYGFKKYQLILSYMLKNKVLLQYKYREFISSLNFIK